MRKTNKINIRVFCDGTAEAKDVFSDAIAARIVRARNEKTVEKDPETGYSKSKVCDESHLALGLCG